MKKDWWGSSEGQSRSQLQVRVDLIQGETEFEFKLNFNGIVFCCLIQAVFRTWETRVQTVSRGRLMHMNNAAGSKQRSSEGFRRGVEQQAEAGCHTLTLLLGSCVFVYSTSTPSLKSLSVSSMWVAPPPFHPDIFVFFFSLLCLLTVNAVKRFQQKVLIIYQPCREMHLWFIACETTGTPHVQKTRWFHFQKAVLWTWHLR